MEKLLQVRNAAKAKKPRFLRQDAHKIKRIPKKWRQPKGIHSKMREKMKGRRRQPSAGWGSPKAVKYLTKSGFMPLLVSDPSKITGDMKSIVVSRTLGLKKRIELIKKATSMKIKILNIPNPENVLKLFEERKKNKIGERPKETSTAAQKIPEETPEQKAEREKEERKKILEKK